MSDTLVFAHDAVIARRVDGRITSWSASAAGLFGYRPSEALGRPFEMLVPEELRERERDVAAGVLRGRLDGRYETVRVCADGSSIAVSVAVSPIRDRASMIVGVSSAEHRIGDRTPPGGGAPDAASHLRSAFDDAHIGIAIVNVDPVDGGCFLRVNRALCELTGHSAEALSAMRVESILHPDDVDADRAAMARLATGEVPGYVLEQRLIHAEQEVVWVMLSASMVRDSAGAPAYCIRQLQDIAERKRFEGELGYLVEHDPLTGLMNRRGFVRELDERIATARRYGGGGAVLFIDLDDFKHINDTLGHSVGDEVISAVARVVFARLRDTDVLARLGGDEFAVLMPHAQPADAAVLARSLLAAVRGADLMPAGSSREVSVSIGITTFDPPGSDLTADDVLADADLAMYAAKEAGKNRVGTASPAVQRRWRSRVTWAHRVRRAVQDGSFELHCQPIVDLATDEVSQWELLLRLPTDDGELVLPSQFLYTAERSGLIVEIDRWVLGEAVQLIAEHRSEGRALRLHVNLSGRSVGDPDLHAFIRRVLGETGIDPASLVLEVTETAAIANLDRARRFARELRQTGCAFALDDFGAGFGSFYYLKHIPFDYVKIDGEFIRQLPVNHTDQLILDSIVQMSAGLGKRTIAEFTGDARTLALLKSHGVDYAQGHHLGRPRPVREALATIYRR